MAIDSKAKRNSALLDAWGVLPFPDGTIDASDRLTLLGFYSGIEATAAGIVPTAPRLLAASSASRYEAATSASRYVLNTDDT